MQSSENTEKNKELILKLLADIEREAQGSETPLDLVAFPENCSYIRVDASTMESGALRLEDSFFSQVGQWSKNNSCQVQLGGVPLIEEGHLYNSTVVIEGPDSVYSAYKKIHLFDVKVGGQAICESDFYKAGTQPRLIEWKGWKIGLSICYDIRFSELYLNYSQQKADIIMVPAAFLPQTGQAHWEPLMRARAIENQAFVLAPAQYGIHPSSSSEKVRKTHGHSLVVDPWGRVLSDQGQAINSFERVRLSYSELEKTRAQIPMENHRVLK